MHQPPLLLLTFARNQSHPSLLHGSGLALLSRTAPGGGGYGGFVGYGFAVMGLEEIYGFAVMGLLWKKFIGLEESFGFAMSLGLGEMG